MLRRLVPVLLVLPMLYWLLPVLLLGAGLALEPTLLRGALGAHLTATLFWVLISLGMEIPAWYGILYPLGAAMTLFIIIRSILRGEKRVEWKGRVYGAESAGPEEASPGA
jgi:hypothetical protein